MQWSSQQVDAAQKLFRSEQGQLTTFDASQFPGQAHVAKNTDGRGMNPTSYGVYAPSLLRTATAQPAPLPTTTPQPANPYQTGGGGTSMLSRYAKAVTNACKKTG